ncbi:MAG: hypothetical protein ACI8W8_004893 [Rhodothermales bacterium]|jgi:hypothetical protein
MAEHADRIEIFDLPKYSPELNPDEFLNSQFKQALRRRPDHRKPGSLVKNARAVMHSIQKRTNKIASCFHAPSTLHAAYFIAASAARATDLSLARRTAGDGTR